MIKGFKKEWRTYSLSEKIRVALYIISILILIRYNIFANTFIDWLFAALACTYLMIDITYRTLKWLLKNKFTKRSREKQL